MTAKIGSMIVDFKARTASLQSGLKKTQKDLRNLKRGSSGTKREVEGFGESLRRLAGPLAIGAAFYGINRMVKQQAAFIDQSKKFADRIGATAKEVTQLGHAAEMTGISQTTLNMSLQRMTRRVSEAAAGGGEAVKALKEIGVSARDLNSMSLDQKMDTLADAFVRVKNDGDRLRLAFKLFDSEGADLVRLLGQGSRALAMFREESFLLGQTVENNTAESVEKANDQITRLGKVTTGFWRQAAGDIMPILGSIADRTVEMVKKLGGVPTIYAKIKLGVMEFALAMNKFFLPATIEATQLGERFARMWDVIKAAGSLAGEAVMLVWQDVGIVIGEAVNTMTKSVRDLAGLAEDTARARGLHATANQFQAIEMAARNAAGQTSESLRQLNAEAAKTAGSARALADSLTAAWHAFIGSDEGGETPGAKTALAVVQNLESGVLALKQKIADGLFNPGSEGEEGGGEEVGAAGGDNMWLTMMGLSKKAQIEAWSQWNAWKFKMLKAGKEAQDEAAKTEQQKLLERIQITQNWANATFDVLRAFGGKSLANNKAFAIGEAVVNTALAITKTIATYGGTPLGWSAAAAVAAAGAAQIAAISSASKGGGSDASFAGGNTTGPVAAANETTVPASNDRELTVNIMIPKHAYVPPETARAISQAIDEFKKDGG